MKYTVGIVMAGFSFLWAEAMQKSVNLDAITVSASPVIEHEAFDVPCQIDAVTDTKEASSASMGEILSKMAGVNNLSTGSQAGKPVIRGFSGERIKMLSNGSPTDSQTYGIRHIDNIDPLLAERIEVIRGAQGVLYGSDALGGVVNVITPDYLVADEGKTLFRGELSGEYHTNNNEKATVLKTQSAVGKWGVNVAASIREADNYHTGDSATWKSGDPAGDLPLFAGELPYTDFKNQSARVGVGYTDDDFKFALQHTYWQSKQNYLGHTPAPAFEAVSSAGQKLTNNETQLSATKNLGEWSVEAKVSMTKNQREAATNTPYQQMQTVRGTPLYLDIDTDRKDFHVALTHPMAGIFMGEVGLEGYVKDQDLKEGKLLPSAKEWGKAVYLFEEANLEKWILQAGLRYDTRSVKAALEGTSSYFVDQGIYDDATNSQEFASWGGSLGATYKIDETWALATNLSKGFRAPGIFELFAGGIHGGVQAFQIGNPYLEEESTLGVDLSLRYKKEETYSSLTFYRNTVDDYIYLANTGLYRNPVTGEVAPTGIPEMKHEQTDAIIQGIEWSFEMPISSMTTLRVSAEYIQGEDTKNDTRLAYIPPSNASIGVTQKLGAFGISSNNELTLDMRVFEEQKVAGAFEPFAQYNNTPFGSADTSGYALFDIGYSTRLQMGKSKVDAHVKVSNLFDRAYRGYLDTYKGYALGMGRDISFGLSVPF
jgi:outer membrane receptor protein involved in Fe transport